MRVKISYGPPRFIRLFLLIFSFIVFVSGCLTLLITIFNLIDLVVKSNETELNSESLFSTILFMLLSYAFFVKSKKGPLVEFDSKFLYVTHKGAEERVELKDIIKIKQHKFGTTGPGKSFYTIEYSTSEKISKRIEINTSFHKNEVERLEYLVHKEKL